MIKELNPPRKGLIGLSAADVRFILHIFDTMEDLDGSSCPRMDELTYRLMNTLEDIEGHDSWLQAGGMDDDTVEVSKQQ
tara:strand:- start:396 stop:632 length:237 start_codon:yes stop_codon:yes gene_type:complete